MCLFCYSHDIIPPIGGFFRTKVRQHIGIEAKRKGQLSYFNKT